MIKQECNDIVTVAKPSTLLSIPTQSSLFPSKVKLHQTLRLIYSTLNGDNIAFMANPTVQSIAKMLYKFYQDDTQLHLFKNDMVYYPCNNGKQLYLINTCQYYSLSQKFSDSKLCHSCKEDKDATKHNDKRIVVSPSRKRPYNSLSHQDKALAYKRKQVDIATAKQKCNRLINRMNAKKAKFVLDDASSAKDIMRDVVTYLTEDLKKTTEEILSMLIEVRFNEEVSETIHLSEKKQCAEYIADSIKNMSLQLNYKKKDEQILTTHHEY